MLTPFPHNPSEDDKNNHHFFGYRSVSDAEKSTLVSAVFDSVASKYNLMNDLMSCGLHRLWKRMMLQRTHLRKGDCALDVAAGTGDIAKQIAKIVGDAGKVILSDVNAAMLEQGRKQLTDDGFVSNTAFVLANAEALPFADNIFDCITIAFGLRNVTNQMLALESMQRVLKPGGCVLILEFSHPAPSLFKKLYDGYSFTVIPRLGQWIAKDRDSYQYLVESIRMHPDQETLKGMMEKSGLETVTYENFSGGVVALHQGYKY